MNGCIYRNKFDVCMKYTTDKATSFCVGRNCRDRKPSNSDRIRAMTDEELAKKMSGLESFALTCGGGWPPEKWLEWLRQEVKK